MIEGGEHLRFRFKEEIVSEVKIGIEQFEDEAIFEGWEFNLKTFEASNYKNYNEKTDVFDD